MVGKVDVTRQRYVISDVIRVESFLGTQLRKLESEMLQEAQMLHDASDFEKVSIRFALKRNDANLVVNGGKLTHDGCVTREFVQMDGL